MTLAKLDSYLVRAVFTGLLCWLAVTALALLCGADGGPDLGTPAGWVQGGGILAFAAVVWRQLERLISALGAVAESMGQILERLARLEAHLDLPAPGPAPRAVTVPGTPRSL